MAIEDKKLTDLTEKATVGNDYLVHVVDTNDVSQSPDGSSFKAKKSALNAGSQKNTIAQIRAFTGVLPNTNFYTTDLGQEGNWYYDAADTTSVDNTGTVLVTADGKRIKRVFDYVTPQMFGAKADGVTNDKTAIEKSFNSGYSVYLKKGQYNITSMITISGSNIKIYGDGDQTVIKSSGISDLISLSTVKGIVFSDLRFETTSTSGGIGGVFGIINSFHTPLENVTFNRCSFSAPNVATNAIKFVNENQSGDFVTKNISFLSCVFENMGRMGIEIQNHAVDTKSRYSEIKIQNCFFKNMGLIEYGMGISLSGYGDNCNIYNNVFSNCRIGVELVGASSSEVDSNSFINFLRPSSTSLEFTGSRIMTQNKVCNNSSNGDTGDIKIWTNQDINLSNNSFSGEIMSVFFRDVSRLRAINENYKTKGIYSTLIEGVSVQNQFINCIFNNSSSTTNNSVFRTNSATCTNTTLQGCSFFKGTGGVVMDAIGGAELAKKYYSDYLNAFYHDTTRNGLKYSISTSKTASTSVLNTVLNIDLGLTGSGFRPFVVNVKVGSTKDNNTGNGFTSNTIWGNHRENSTINVRGNNVIGTATDLTITTSVSGTKLVLTCTHSSIDALLMYWDLDITSQNTPIIT